MNRKQNYLGGNSEYCNKRKHSINITEQREDSRNIYRKIFLSQKDDSKLMQM